MLHYEPKDLSVVEVHRLPFQYLKRSCNGTTPDDILRKMAEEMVGMIPWVTELAKVSGTEPTKTETRGHGTYPFPGTNEIDSIKLKDFQAYDEFPWAKGLRGGARLFKVVYDNVNQRNIEVLLSTPEGTDFEWRRRGHRHAR